MSEQDTSTDSWDGLLTNYLKGEDVKNKVGEEIQVPCIDVKRKDDQLDLVIEFEDKRRSFSLNKTNMGFIKSKGLVPKDVIGKMITLQKTMAMNPTLKKEVPSLRISKIE